MENKNSEILNSIITLYGDEDILKATGLDKAVIGIDHNTIRLIYSYKKIIQILNHKKETLMLKKLLMIY